MLCNCQYAKAYQGKCIWLKLYYCWLYKQARNPGNFSFSVTEPWHFPSRMIGKFRNSNQDFLSHMSDARISHLIYHMPRHVIWHGKHATCSSWGFSAASPGLGLTQDIETHKFTTLDVMFCQVMSVM
jgi:hypothetical protein